VIRLRRGSGEPGARAAAVRRRLRYPPAHWWLLAVCLGVILVILFIEGVASHTIGTSAETDAGNSTTAPLKGSQPLLTSRGDQLLSSEPPAGNRVALTFDDGPDPKWTPRIEAVLRRERVPAAFFVVGSQAAQQPDVIRMLQRDGQEIGNHTATHADLTATEGWQRRAQVGLTDAVVVGLTGRYPRFLRPPYSATSDAITPQQEKALARLAGRRYILALADYDSKDWQRRGVERTVDNATPPGRRGGIIMFHDGGGDRAQTVRAVEELIPRLRARGFRFVSLGALAGLPPSVVSPRAAALERSRGLGFAWSVRLAFLLATVLSAALVAIGALVALRALALITLAAHHTHSSRGRGPGEGHEPQVSIVVPAYNEAVGIEKAVRSLAGADYPRFEVIVVDDGSTDGTAELVDGLALAGVTVIRRPNGGKAAALNTGIAASSGDIVVMVDGDTVFEPRTLWALVQPFTDPLVGAASGNTKVGNRRGLLGRWQHIEYVMGFNLDRRMYEVLQCTPTVPGAVGAFRRDVLEAVGGVSGQTLAEDTDLTLAIGRLGKRVVYVEDARAWTEAPSTLTGLWRQRYRWSYGTMQAVWKHKGAMLSRDPRQRRIGRRAIPYMIFFQIALPVAAPLIDIFALYGLLFTDPVRVTIYWLGFNALQLAIAAFAFRIDREPLRVLWAVPLQQFVYRQLMYLVIIESTISALVGVRSGWKNIERTGEILIPDEPLAAHGHLNP